MKRNTEKMKNKKNLIKNKKGISSLFISVYIALLALILMSTLFLDIEISRSSTTKYLQSEQQRMQESILIYGPGGMRPYGSGESIVGSIRVNNTGSTTVRIRAFYIGQIFICDPSMFGDTYISPKESKWINLVSARIAINDTVLRLPWTMMTERGVKTTEIGAILWLGGTDDQRHNTNEFYIGPLMLLFDKFQWKTGNSQWESGWAIPKVMNDVTWRIILMNIDARPLTISDSSFFNLVLNDNEPKDIKWYISPNQEKTLTPWKYYYIEFSLAPNGDLQDMSGFTEGYTCINFLTLTGDFTETNGAKTAFGQTIPFEAVLVTGSNTITISAAPSTIRTGTGPSSQSTITAFVKDADGNPVQNELVSFTTTRGTLSYPFAVTDISGMATVILTAGDTPGAATVTAEIQGMSVSAIVTINSFTTTLSLTPAASVVGNAVTVSGMNYQPNSAITITYDGTTVATATATSSGTIPSGITFTAPSSIVGPHTVKATDTGANSATATFTINPKININPTAGPAGTTLTISGQGFAPSSKLTVTFAGITVTTSPSTVTTNPLGSFSDVTLTVPSSTDGGKILRVTDANGNYATFTFTLGTRSITLTPTSGTIGTSVTVTGSNYLPNSPVTVQFDGTTVNTNPAVITSSNIGTFSASFTIPTSTDGSHTVSAIDSSTNSASAPLMVSVPSTNPSISLNPTSGKKNTNFQIDVTGQNFAASSAITLTFDSGAVPITVSPTTITTDNTGKFTTATIQVTLPNDARDHMVKAVDSSGNTATATFTTTNK